MHTNQASVSYFKEERNGSDIAYSFISKQTDIEQIKANLKQKGITNFNLAQIKNGVKISIIDSKNRKSHLITNLAKDYGKPKAFVGTAGIIRQEDYAKNHRPSTAQDQLRELQEQGLVEVVPSEKSFCLIFSNSAEEV